ncbi:hypothetical protein TNIN_435541 [Trichonephila inaurata madagascariensis]|uniref:Uncharacterized protein n=1 Tax=Trichonephila inaurata madagascariensis TaxID=2747483 RepID=A0A8X6KH50_9ARAC|nr:hypothetical protein TNIN_487121 [Trichonephila inaurata madagascariensis]GFY72263.1 hypothetical protein TNIN_435541 [Trichonephila inaurata madagascariensis]
MTATLTLSESFISDMDSEDTEVRVEKMEWEPSYIQVSEPMDWEDIPQVRASKRSKSLPNPSLQVKLTLPTPQKVSPITSEFIRHKIRSKPKVSIPEVSGAPSDRVILKAWRPTSFRI